MNIDYIFWINCVGHGNSFDIVEKVKNEFKIMRGVLKMNYESRCNMCESYFKNDDELVLLKDETGYYKGCPTCKTDEYLIDLE